MSSEPLALRAEGLSKRYRISQREPYKALRDVLTDNVSNLFRRRGVPPEEQVWALRDVSFELQRGEVLGLIGANGAGKSTLLKILSRITEPTEGRAVLSGRVGSLLEVGTGFHPELTGRENIFLNGTILGMRRTEILRRFDEIVEFAGMARFLDTPVKRYSSGMQARLAFAVAAHLQPEILLVDEVLAVGDAEFQQRCLGKMKDVTREGRTVVFVSHNLAAVRSLCTRALLLEKGRLVFDGDTGEAAERYLGKLRPGTGAVVEEPQLHLHLAESHQFTESPLFTCSRIATIDERGEPSSSFRSDEEIAVAVDYTMHRAGPAPRIVVTLTDDNQAAVLRTDSADDPEQEDGALVEPGEYRAVVGIARDLLGDAQLDLNVELDAGLTQIVRYAALVQLHVHFAGVGGNLHGKAYMRPALRWRVAPLAADRVHRVG
jgi:lipopolysaccharide transport system ATP-binding protein